MEIALIAWIATRGSAWDLTQPQAMLIASVISGVLLIVAAYIAFHGQREARRQEAAQFTRQLGQQSEHFTQQLAAQSEQFMEQLRTQSANLQLELEHKAEQWKAEREVVNRATFRSEVRSVYVRTLVHVNKLRYFIHEGLSLKPGEDKLPDDYRKRFESMLTDATDVFAEMRLVGNEVVIVEMDKYNVAVRALRAENPHSRERVDELYDLLKGLAVVMRDHLGELSAVERVQIAGSAEAEAEAEAGTVA